MARKTDQERPEQGNGDDLAETKRIMERLVKTPPKPHKPHKPIEKKKKVGGQRKPESSKRPPSK